MRDGRERVGRDELLIAHARGCTHQRERGQAKEKARSRSGARGQVRAREREYQQTSEDDTLRAKQIAIACRWLLCVCMRVCA